MLEIKGNHFLLNGKPFQILSGAIHYFRVVPEYWEDRLKKLKACGLNTVETYIPWNFHEPQKGLFHFTGMGDLQGFIREAEKLGLYVILRPSPYICAEWEFGGLPAWLLKDKNIELRCSDPVFLHHINEYYDVLIPKITPFLIENGGPVIAIQIENEYGGYGNDRSYLTFLREALVSRGLTCLLFTSDGPDMLNSGSLPDILPTVNFGSRATESFDKLNDFREGIPHMCMEFWIGWFDHWGGEHHTRPGKDTALVLEEMLKAGHSVNFYMFHGGTNFGFYNGANQYEEYTPTITSYDYDALLTESGDITEKYEEVKKVISKYTEIPEVEIEPIAKIKYGKVEIEEEISLFDTLSSICKEPTFNSYPLTMEQVNQNYGFILYKTSVNFTGECNLDITSIRDRAFIYINGKLQKTIYRNDQIKVVPLQFDCKKSTIEILVENMGRVNYGKNLKDPKGIVGGIWLNNQYVYNWEIHSIELDTLPISFSSKDQVRYPKFFKGSFKADEIGDTFLALPGWTKGNAFINGFNLGRYWSIGPQNTLYIPAPLLKEGSNEIIILELEGNDGIEVNLLDVPQLG